MPLIYCKTINVWIFLVQYVLFFWLNILCDVLCAHMHYLDVQQIEQLLRSDWAAEGTARWNSDVPCAWRKAASDVFLDGLNNECLKRVLGPQLPNLPLSSALTCSPCTCLEKGGQGGACLHPNQSNPLPLSPAVTGNSKRSLTCRIWTQH